MDVYRHEVFDPNQEGSIGELLDNVPREWSLSHIVPFKENMSIAVFSRWVSE